MAQSEGLTGEMASLFDTKLAAILAAMGLNEKDEDIVQQCGGLRIRVYEPGEYVDKLTGEKRKYEAGIDLKQGSISLHVEASDIAQLIYHCRNTKVLNKALEGRLEKEKELLREIGF